MTLDQPPDHPADAVEAPAPRPAAPDDGVPRLRLAGVSKRFGAVRAIRTGDMTIRAGRVHALVGENGARKSSLMRVLAGVHRPNEGTSAVSWASPLRWARGPSSPPSRRSSSVGSCWVVGAVGSWLPSPGR